MERVKRTSSELKRLRGDLERYRRYLPTLMLKKVYIQVEHARLRERLVECERGLRDLWEDLKGWVALLGEDWGISDLVQVEAVDVERENVAGVEIPLFKGVRFLQVSYNLFTTPFWTEAALEAAGKLVELEARKRILADALEILEGELLNTSQRVNLFEKVLIPLTERNIRIIQIALSEQQTAAVIRGKIAKGKAMGQPGPAAEMQEGPP